MCLREIGELRKELERQREEAAKAKKALEDKVAEELVLKGELDADEVRHVMPISILSASGSYTHPREATHERGGSTLVIMSGMKSLGYLGCSWLLLNKALNSAVLFGRK